MKLSDFVLLTLEEKGHMCLRTGSLLAKRTTGTHLVFLFQIESFYVEMLCCLKSKELEEVRMFEGVAPLTPYLDTIKIDDIFK
jgi:hypothetical protein